MFLAKAQVSVAQVWVAVLVVAGLALSGCGGSSPVGGDDGLAPSSGVEGVVAAPVESDEPPPPPPPPAQRFDAVRLETSNHVQAQIPGSEVAVGEPTVWLRPGDTGERYIVDWQATTDAGVTSGGATLLANSDGTFTVAQSVSEVADGPEAVAGLSADSFVVSIEDQPSQSPADAARDGIASFVGELPLYQRVDLGWGSPDYLDAPVDIGKRWILSRYPLPVGQQLREAGELADVDTILAYELLELNAGAAEPAQVTRAIPLDVLSPAWVAEGNGAVYSGRRAPTSRLNPVLVRIDSTTGEVRRLVAILPERVISDPALIPAGWEIATPEQTALMIEIKHVNPDFVAIDEIFSMAG